MLLRFGVQNYLSIREYQELSLVASALSDKGTDTYPVSGVGVSVLPAVAIYGANASGKSNFLTSFNVFRNCILNSDQKGNGVNRPQQQYFALDSKQAELPTTFDCDFVDTKGVRFHYGFSVDQERITEEWLYAFPKKYQQTWYYRSVNEDEEFYFGEKLRGANRTIEKLTRPDSLFLSVAATNNHKQLTEIYEYFSSMWANFDASSLAAGNPNRIVDYLNDSSTKNRFIKFIKHADIGVSDIEVEDVEQSESSRKMMREFSRVLRKYVPDRELGDLDAPSKQIRLGHTSSSGKPVYLSWELESHGTHFILGLLGPVFGALDKGQTLFVDELETSSHPLVSREVLRLFCSKESNPNGAQIIFSTHDTNLLSAGVLRRDQIWFVQKGRSGATSLFPLTDIKTRKTDNIEKGYLEGRFGGIPYIDNLLWTLADS